MTDHRPSHRFDLFDVVRVIDRSLDTHSSKIQTGTTGTIMEVLEDGQAYLVELMGDWSGTDDAATLVLLAEAEVPDIFRETLGIEVFRAEQLELVKPAAKTVGQSLQPPSNPHSHNR